MTKMALTDPSGVLVTPEGERYVVKERINRKGQEVQERFYATPCACGAIRWLRRKDQTRSEQCFICSQRSKAPSGYKAMLAALTKKHGTNNGQTAASFLLRKRLNADVPKSERILRELLPTAEYNAPLPATRRGYLADALVSVEDGGALVIEINGGIHRLRQERDSAKYVSILLAGINLIVVDDDETLADWLWKGTLC